MKEYEEAIDAIPFFKLHPEYKPFIGERYSDFRVLQVGESHYIGQRIEDEEDDFPIAYFEKWWDDPCERLKYHPDQNPKEGLWGGWYDTRAVIRRFLDRNQGNYSIFMNLIRAFDDVLTSGPHNSGNLEGKQKYHYFAFMNFFQMPALYSGVSFERSLYKSAEKTAEPDVAKSLYERAVQESCGILDQIIEIIKPETVIITSSAAWYAYKERGKYWSSPEAPTVIRTVHPCCSWWNRKIKRFGGKTGREQLAEKLREIYLE